MTDGLRARYDSEAGAAAYARKYETGLLRRISGARELRLVRWAVRTAAVRGGTVLDVPCGVGRLEPVLLSTFDRVTALDRSPAMVERARGALSGSITAGRVDLAEGDATRLPFPDGAFAASICWRLLHHLTSRETRGGILRELARVSREAVVVSFADAGTWKARSQRLRRRNRRCATWTAAELGAEARAASLTLVATRRLSSPFSLLAVAVFRPSDTQTDRSVSA